MAIERVGVVGCGLMGSGIAEVCARSGRDVVVLEVDEAAVSTGRRNIEHSLARAVQSGKLSGEARGIALDHLGFTTDYADLADRELVVEAVIESEAEKLQVFSMLDKAVESPDAILASNTSSIPIMKLAMATDRPEHVLGLHFFNPVPVMRLVELIPSIITSAAVADRAGFVVNALLVPYLLSAVRMLESGFATADDIDSGMVEGCAHPMGPLHLCDLIGNDTVVAVAQSLYEEFKEPLFAPPPLLLRMVEAGLLGRKTGRGFWDYRKS